jgi:hypothetical protein
VLQLPLAMSCQLSMKHGQSICIMCNVAGFKENAREGFWCNNIDVSSSNLPGQRRRSETITTKVIRASLLKFWDERIGRCLDYTSIQRECSFGRRGARDEEQGRRTGKA